MFISYFWGAELIVFSLFNKISGQDTAFNMEVLISSRWDLGWFLFSYLQFCLFPKFSANFSPGYLFKKFVKIAKMYFLIHKK